MAEVKYSRHVITTDQYDWMETGWQNLVSSIKDDDLFNSLQKIVNDMEQLVEQDWRTFSPTLLDKTTILLRYAMLCNAMQHYAMPKPFIEVT